MNWLKFIKRFLINLVMAIVVSVVLLGLGGLATGWQTGLINGAGWGLLFGAMGGLSIGVLFALQPCYWEDFAGRFAGWWVKHKEPAEDEDPERELEKSRGILPVLSGNTEKTGNNGFSRINPEYLKHKGDRRRYPAFFGLLYLFIRRSVNPFFIIRVFPYFPYNPC